jgi:hypothetical protein
MFRRSVGLSIPLRIFPISALQVYLVHYVPIFHNMSAQRFPDRPRV